MVQLYCTATFDQQDFRIVGRTLNLIDTQLRTDNSSSGTQRLFMDFNVELDGDLGGCNFNESRLCELLHWIRKTLDLPEHDLFFERKGPKEAYIRVNFNIKQNVLNFMTHHWDNSMRMQVGPRMNKLAFYTIDPHNSKNMGHKALALMQSYYAKKDSTFGYTFVIDHDRLSSFFNVFAKTKDGSTTALLCCQGGVHWVSLLCLKLSSQAHVIEMDSLGISKDRNRPISKLYTLKALSQSLLVDSNLHVYRAHNQRQMDSNHCSLFALKDARKMLAMEDVLSRVQKNIIHTKKVGAMIYSEYLTPLPFMATVQSKGKIDAYVGMAPHVSKDNVLMLSYNKVRRTKAPGMIYPSMTDSSQNATVPYFQHKYMEEVLQAMIEKLTLDELVTIVQRYDANQISLESLNESTCRRLPINIKAKPI